MFLLFLGFGTANVNAQVRIGGNTAPSKAAVLDLNATDAANTGTGGLVLPRVNLTTNAMQLTTGVANLIGTMVYDVTATLGQIGIYYWNGNSWVKASLPSTSAADSGKVLMSNGSTAIWGSIKLPIGPVASPLTSYPRVSVNWSIVLDTIYTAAMALDVNNSTYVYVNGLATTDLCFAIGNPACATANVAGYVYLLPMRNQGFPAGTQLHLKCYRPSA